MSFMTTLTSILESPRMDVFIKSVFWGFRARIKTPLVLGVLFKPVSETSSASVNPIFSISARKSFPGMAPPSH